MMKTAAYKILFALIIAAGTVTVSGRHLPDSLAIYLEIAAKENPGVQQRLTEYQAALQKVPQVGSLPDPELSAGVFLKPMELVNGKQVADLRLMQMFPWFGVLRDAKDEMSLMAKAKYELFRDARSQVFYDVQRTWYELSGIREETRITEKNIEILKTVERLTLVRFQSPSGGVSTQPSGSMASGTSRGAVPGSASGMQGMSGSNASMGVSSSGSSASSMEPSSMQSSSMGSSSGGSGLTDLYRIQLEINEVENDIELLQNRERTVIARFNSYLNRNSLSPVYTDTVLQAQSLIFSEAAVLDSILANNPMLSMLDYEVQSFDSRRKMVTGMSYPMVGLGISYSIINQNPMSTSTMNGMDMVMPMVTVSLPIYRKKYNAMKNEADLLKSAAEQNFSSTSNSLQAEFYSALQSYQDASRRVKLYHEQYSLASRTLDLVMKDFSTSASSLTDVLKIRQQVLDYELKLVESNVDLNSAVAWVRRLMASDITQ